MPKVITIRGEIGWDEKATPRYLERELASAAGQDVILEINSPGGYVFDGLEMANMIRNYSGHVTARIEGVAASMASYIPMLADAFEVEDNTVFMIHNPSGGAFGVDYRGAETLRDILEGLAGMLAKAYADKSGKPVAEIRTMMDTDTWLFGEGIVEAGFADAVIGDSHDADAEAAIATAKSRVKACEERMRAASDKPQQMEKIAALLGSMGAPEPKPRTDPEPKLEPEEVIMTLAEFFEKNPEAKAEYDAMIKAKVDEAVKATAEIAEKKGRDDMIAAAKAIMPIMSSASYPEAVKARVMTQFESGNAETLKSAVEIFDMGAEQAKDEAAHKEQEGQGETPAQDVTGLSENGEITDASQIPDAVAQMKQQSGRGGN